MSWQLTYHVLPQVAAVSVSLVLATIVWRYRESRGSVPLLVTLVGTVGWSTTYALQIASTELGSKLFWNDLRYLFVLVAVLGYFAFAAQYTSNDRWLRQPLLLAIVFPATVTIALVFTNDAHGLIRVNEAVVDVGPTALLEFDLGHWFWVHLTYTYILVATAVFWIVRFARRNWTIYRDQSITIVVAVAIPWVMNGLYILDVTTVEYTSFGLCLSAVAFAWAMYRYDLLDLVPIARERVVEEMRDGVIVLDIEDRIVDLNEAALPVLTVEQQSAALGANVLTQLAASPGDDHDRSIARYRQVADGNGFAQSRDVRGVTEDRENEIESDSRDEDGDRDRVVSAEGGSVAQSVTDEDGFETIVGIALEDLFGRDIYESCATEVTCIVDGDQRHYVLSLSPLHDSGGKPTGRLVVAEDVTAIKRREHELEEMARTLEERSHQLELRNREQATLIENLPGVVYRCTDVESECVTFVSTGAQALTGYTVEAFESGAISFRAIIYPDDLETTLQQRSIAIADSARFDVVYRIVTNDETQRWVRDIGKGVYDEDGDLEFVEGFVLDVTENKQREQLQVLNRVLRHNIRNEMNVVSGRLDLALAEAGPAVEEHLEVVSRASNRVTRLGTKAREIQGLLDGEGAPEIEQIDVTRTVECVIARFSEECSREIAFETPDTEKLVVYGNELLETAVYELLENAVVHGTDTGVDGSPDTDAPGTIVVTVEPTSDERAEIRIQDDGPGIPTSELEAITGRVESPLVHGSGLGLWIVRWIVDAYGDLEIESDRSGTTAIVRLRRIDE